VPRPTIVPVSDVRRARHSQVLADPVHHTRYIHHAAEVGLDGARPLVGRALAAAGVLPDALAALAMRLTGAVAELNVCLRDARWAPDPGGRAVARRDAAATVTEIQALLDRCPATLRPAA
jgi:hypothetical protein